MMVPALNTASAASSAAFRMASKFSARFAAAAASSTLFLATSRATEIMEPLEMSSFVFQDDVGVKLEKLARLLLTLNSPASCF
ncbi:Os10g0559650 [Oryza sativa Japonica Group]|uniref:Os10g0559650 protein n=1 Tax=Oryza sativa subsp. japonica TaxID=39947 RepID=A0A0P0XX63_ORYSJ|nr:hypothetical protein EE612_052757 [Oryza sativa]BAT12036.1 Os10g0559650 [Oryza sativa Japonica Group]